MVTSNVSIQSFYTWSDYLWNGRKNHGFRLMMWACGALISVMMWMPVGVTRNTEFPLFLSWFRMWGWRRRRRWLQCRGNQSPPPNSVWFGVTPLKVGAKAASTGCWKIKDICFLACAMRFNNTWWDYGLTRPGGTCHAIGLSGCHLIVDVRHHYR